jgi:MGT family glycosyltransferase
MASFIFATFPVSGHVNPLLPIARELVERGHDVRWYTTPRFRRAVEGAGARYVPYHDATPIDEESLSHFWPDRPKAGLRQLQYDLKMFINLIPGQLRDLEAELARETADVIVGDNASGVCHFLRERTGIPWAVVGVTVLSIPRRDVAPFGLALRPSSTLLGRLRNKALQTLVDDVIFRGANQRFRDIRHELGMPAYRRSMFDAARDSDLFLQTSVPSFDYPRTDLPPQLHFIGASIPQPPSDWTPPRWWRDLDGRRQVVLVTQGTINNDYDELVRPAIRALANEDVLVVVTTGSRPASDLGIDLPENVRVERFIPYAHLMPKVELLLTNGGYGSIQIALAHGVPIVAIGKTEEKPEIANRVAHAGVGVGLKVRKPSEFQIRTAVREVLDNPYYHARAEALRYEMNGLDATRTGADLLEELTGGSDELARIA